MLGTYIKEKMDELNITPNQLSKTTGISITGVRETINEDKIPVKYLTLFKISEEIKCDVDYLINLALDDMKTRSFNIFMEEKKNYILLNNIKKGSV